ncbi:BEACH domain-containing protein [Chloropicon primus]|uniref:BEACH domain-containing protein n=1 Tax=Chloropicon primus TaxID=1764295 RepID=A0A5B8MWG9_9CHLO|nr:BEACH domain-containing protein [Chloropicon primus]UPR03725.1 BEACH domain-containing protein [Chloropicon primus]|mmetsp:Transcript_1959/g.5323  ORF Transcript_1959/g.5323 Transcript_1959/m.5323 type:complete len:707 (+) Transcript_1959:351-2471(+)|eukprot:QDZ24516.1 BEACH domain-containing protein [Chloropicon primus]
MLKQRKASSRFSLLLLDEGEEYEGDWVAVLSTKDEADLKGRLRLCSMSIAFDPTDSRSPILKFPLKDTVSLEPVGEKQFRLTTSTVVRMKQNNRDVPYKTVRSRSDFLFTLSYAPLPQVLPVLHEALYLSQQSRHDLLKLLKERQVKKLRGSQNTFDTAMYLRDAINEKILANVPCILQAPLVHSPGRLVVTTECVYFQQLHDIEGNSPCKIHQVKDIVACCKKKSKLREQMALELLFWKPRNPSAPKWDTSSAFFAFQSRQECHDVWKTLALHSMIGTDTPVGQNGAKIASKLFADSLTSFRKGRCDTQAMLERVTACWQKGSVSNFHYLVVLNLLSGRTFNDLSQWPVMPWILKDYSSASLDLDTEGTFRDLSKPVGALNADRLSMLRERFSLMPDDDPDNPPFLYGTHYSNPGYVMYWLVRAAPGHLLRLQSGRFDAPDRMFHSMQESWSSVLSNQADVKELIPEFFVRGLAVKFLQANEALPLGKRQNGEPIDEVELPPWAGSPLDFATKHRKALDESSYVNGNLNKWIDLIFGCKQRGKGAVEADNVFHITTYYTSGDLAKIQDEVHRDAVEQQAQEFGQTPGQLFSGAHPGRNLAAGGEGEASQRLPSEEEDYLASSSVVAVVEALISSGFALTGSLDLACPSDFEEPAPASVVPRREPQQPKAADPGPAKGEHPAQGGESKLITTLSNRFLGGFNFRSK